MRSARARLVWAALIAALAAPIAIAATSPLLAWRDPIYIAAGFAGVVAFALLLVQPLAAGGYLPGLGPRRARRLHATVGAALVVAVAVHVGGLWLTSPPDVVDALLFRAPASFSAWGVVAMWAAFGAALLAAARPWLRLPPAVWRLCHLGLAAVLVLGAVLHALPIEGAMEPWSKAALSALVAAAAVKLTLDKRPWRALARRRP